MKSTELRVTLYFRNILLWGTCGHSQKSWRLIKYTCLSYIYSLIDQFLQTINQNLCFGLFQDPLPEVRACCKTSQFISKACQVLQIYNYCTCRQNSFNSIFLLAVLIFIKTNILRQHKPNCSVNKQKKLQFLDFFSRISL